jgi:hypothetical protein
MPLGRHHRNVSLRPIANIRGIDSSLLASKAARLSHARQRDSTRRTPGDDDFPAPSQFPIPSDRTFIACELLGKVDRQYQAGDSAEGVGSCEGKPALDVPPALTQMRRGSRISSVGRAAVL